MSWVLGGLALSKACEGQVGDKVMVKIRLNGIRRREIMPDWKKTTQIGTRGNLIFS